MATSTRSRHIRLQHQDWCRKHFFDQPVRNSTKTYVNISKIATEPVCILDFCCYKESYKLIVKDLSKQQALDSDQKSIQQINFNGN